jgi:ureidoacrylate peracid hydrolase
VPHAPFHTDGLELDPTRTAVVVVDVQRLFTDLIPFPLAPPLSSVLPTITRVLDAARRAALSVVLVRSILTPDQHSDNTRTWPPFMVDNMAPGTPGTEFDPCLQRSDNDVVIVKRRYSAFHGTSLDETLRTRGISTLVIFGLTTNVCVQSTVRDSWQHDYRTITIADCCAETSEPADAHESALYFCGRNFGTVTTSDVFIDAVAPARPAPADGPT